MVAHVVYWNSVRAVCRSVLAWVLRALAGSCRNWLCTCCATWLACRLDCTGSEQPELLNDGVERIILQAVLRGFIFPQIFNHLPALQLHIASGG